MQGAIDHSARVDFLKKDVYATRSRIVHLLPVLNYYALNSGTKIKEKICHYYTKE